MSYIYLNTGKERAGVEDSGAGSCLLGDTRSFRPALGDDGAVLRAIGLVWLGRFTAWSIAVVIKTPKAPRTGTYLRRTVCPCSCTERGLYEVPIS